MRLWTRTMLGAAAITLVCGSALAQASVQRARAPRGDGSTNIVVTDDDGTNTQLILRNGEISAFVNGKRVPEDRIVKEDGKLRIMDEDGKVVREFQMDLEGGGLWTVDDDGFLADRKVALAEMAPRAFMGVTLGDVGEATAAQLGLDGAQVVLITGVTPGQPAEAAGLQRHDIVVKIDGSGPADSTTLRKKLAEKKPGDEVELVVVRGGDEQKVRIKLGEAPAVSAYAFGDQQMARAWQERAMAEQERNRLAFTMDQLREQMDHGRQAWEDAIDRLSEEWDDLDLSLSDEDREKLEEALARVREQLEDLDVEIDLPRVRIFGGDNGRDAVIVPQPPMAPRAVPAPPAGTYRFVPEAGATGASDDRLKKIEERMDRIEALLEKLAAKESGRSS